MLPKYSAHPDRYDSLRDFAREERKHMTLAENVLWQRIRKKRLGHKFVRQYVIGDYVVDFACIDDGLIIEVDGGYHFAGDQPVEDAIRQRYIEQNGFHVMRFTNEEVLFDVENVLTQIEQFFK
jgi:Uncharacterized protein conserved in bacteria